MIDEQGGNEPERRWGWTELALFLGLSIPFFVAAFASALGFLTVLGVQAKGVRVLVPQFAGFAATLIPLRLIFRWRLDQSPMEALRMRIAPGDGPRALLTGTATAIAVLALAALLRVPRLETPMEEMLSDTASLALAAVLGVTLGPWFEELVFRGLLQPLLVRHIGVMAGIALAALPFALLHGPQYGWSWRHIVLILAAGMAFGWRRHRMDSTGSAVLMHGGYNLFLFAGYIAGKYAGGSVPQTF